MTIEALAEEGDEATDADVPWAAFDAVAAGYDRAFTDTALGRTLRARVWRWTDRTFGPGDRVLELGCGTGADASHLAERGVSVVATDASAGMLTMARARLESRGATDLVTLDRLDLGDPADIARLHGLGPFDGVVSDFGALNALPDRRPLADALASAVRPGGTLVLVVMGPLCPWEIAWHLAHGEPRVAGRRWRRGGVARVAGNARLRVWYPAPATLRGEFEPAFRVVALAGLGVALPPSGLAGIVERRPRLLAALAAVEDRLAGVAASAWSADHYVAVLVRA